MTPLGREALADAASLFPRESDYLVHFTELSRRYPPDLARHALEMAILRLEASSRFPGAQSMFFTRPALEQSSHPAISAYRLRRFAAFERVFDLGCSIGADTLALAGMVPSIGVDLDPLRLAMAAANLSAQAPDANASFIQANLVHSLPFNLTSDEAIFFDPARRVAGRRLHSVRDYLPPLEIVRDWLPDIPAIGVKISPGVKAVELATYRAEIEFISLDGELKEAVLWFGPLQTASRRATVLPGPYTLAAAIQNTPRPDPLSDSDLQLQLSDPRAYLYEPDPAILRAGLVRRLAEELDASQIDADIAFLTSDRLIQTPFARAYPVDAWLPFNLKKLRLALRQRGVESIVVKKRGSPIPPKSLIRRLGMKPGRGSLPGERIVFLTQLRDMPVAVICLASL